MPDHDLKLSGLVTYVNDPLASAAMPPLRYPSARRADVADDYHGVRVADPYRWLEDPDSPETRAWIDAQNRLTREVLDAIPERPAIRRRVEALWNYPRHGVPAVKAGRYFYSKNDGLQNQAVLQVADGLEAPPRVLLDPNILAPDGTVALSVSAPSHDGRHLAYALSASGSDWLEIRVRDVATGEDRPDRLSWVKFSAIAWTHDGAGFYYSRYPAPAGGNPLLTVNEHQRLYYHRLGTAQDADLLIWERPDEPDWGIAAEVSPDGRYLVGAIWVGTDRRNRLWYADLGNAASPDLGAPWRALCDAFDAGYAFLGNDGPRFYVVTDCEAPRRRIVAIDLGHPAPARWQAVVPERAETLEHAALARDTIVASYLTDAHARLIRVGTDGRARGDIPLPALGTVAELSAERDRDEVFFAYTGYLEPAAVYRHDVATGATARWRGGTVAADLSPYETTLTFAASRDGTRVPVYLTARRDLPRDGSTPVYLYGYGGFGVNLTPAFSPGVVAWLELGGAFAVAVLRGGGEYGEEWHAAGMLGKKQNVFDDFVAAAEHLIATGVTAPARLAIGGGSNGGLLVGAALTQRPELFAAACPAVGVFDMLRYHRFTIGRAWMPEYGSADRPDEFRVLYAYSPLHRLRAGTAYPATLITTADHDDRVVPGHSFKFAAALQAAQGGAAPVLLRVETRAGHGAGKATAKVLDEQADRWAFLVHVLGMRSAPPRVS